MKRTRVGVPSTITSLCLVAVCSSCSVRPGGGCLHYLTWQSYDGTGEMEDAVYVFDGASTGKGRKGFLAAVSEIKKLPKGSKLLIYPDYYLTGGVSSGPVRLPPYRNYRRRLGEVVQCMELRVFYSKGVWTYDDSASKPSGGEASVEGDRQ